MELPKKLKLIRALKNWTQEEVAEKLEISINSYAKIERGETDVNFSRLQQIAEIMEIELLQLLELDEKNVFHLTSSNYTNTNKGDNWYVNSSSNELMECKHELEKAKLINERQQKEIDYLKQQMSDLRDIVNLLKKPDKQE